MLNSSPDIPQFRELMHLSRQEICTRRKHLSITTPIMCSMHMYSSSRAHTIPHKRRPIQNRRRRLPNLHQFSNSIRMQEANIRSLNLPRLMLRRSRQFRQIHRQERSINQTMNEMINQLAEHQNSTIRLPKKAIQRRKRILRFRGPNIQIRAYFRKIRQRMPRKM